MAELSSGNKQSLIDAVVHAVNEDYYGMAQDFIKLVQIWTPPISVKVNMSCGQDPGADPIHQIIVDRCNTISDHWGQMIEIHPLYSPLDGTVLWMSKSQAGLD